MSAPAANARSEPVNTTHRIASLPATTSSAEAISATVALFNAFRTLGRFNRINATASRSSSRMF
jgi:hypothetical protein